MAVTETVKIVFDVDNKAITDTVNDLAALGKVSQEDAAKFKQLSDASKTASKDLAAVGKSAESLKTVGASISEASDGFVPLRDRLREAKLEVQRLGEQFNNSGPEFEAAVARAGELADEFDDLNRQVRLSNPEGKIEAFQKLGQGLVGAFGIATGALQAFGAENEEVQAIAQKLQGALNIAQGVQSIVGLKEAYQDVKVVLGLTSVAQTTLTTATTAGTVATEGAAVATRGFAAALSSTGIGALVVALGALIGYLILSQDETDELTEKTNAKAEADKKWNDELERRTNELQKQIDLGLKEASFREGSVQVLERELNLIRAKGGTAKQVFDAEQKIRQKELENLEKIIKIKVANGVTDESLLDSQIAAANKRNEIQAAALAFQVEQGQKGVEAAKKAEEDRIQALEDANKRREEIYQNQLSLQRQFEAELSSQLGDINQELSLEKLQNQVKFFGDQDALRRADTQSEINSIDKKLEKLKEFGKEGTDEYKTLTLQRELVVKNGAAAEAKAVEDAEKKKQDAAQKTYDQYKELGEKQKKIDQEKLESQIDSANFILEQAKGITDFVVEQSQRESDEKIARLQEEKEQGLITEETYEARVKQIKQKAAEDNKKAQVFQAVLSATQAILTALTVQPATAVPAAVAFASVVGALNLAKILATPVPKFKDGTLSVPGQDHGRDSVYAMLRPGEAVIPTETNRMYAPTIEAIYRKRVKASEINAFVLNRMTGKGSIGRDTAITASVDTFALGRVMSKQKTVEVGNANIVGKAIAGEIMKAYNPRRS
jgi:hypothetical protein